MGNPKGTVQSEVANICVLKVLTRLVLCTIPVSPHLLARLKVAILVLDSSSQTTSVRGPLGYNHATSLFFLFVAAAAFCLPIVAPLRVR